MLFCRQTTRSLIAFLLLAAGSREGLAVDIGIWDRFEVSIANSKTYRDPYRDVTLNVTYTRPAGGTVTFWGFYDGGASWKIRFMPDQLGVWRYDAKFSDGATGKSGSFTCIGSSIPGMIGREEANPIWFGYRGGGHVLIRSFHVGDRFFASNWAESKRKMFFDWAEGQGYNMLSIGSHYLNRDEKSRGRGWNTPDIWNNDTCRPQPGEFRKMEAILDDLAARRILVFPFAGFFGAGSDYPVTNAGQTLYIKYTLARLGPYWNCLLNVAGPELAKWRLSASQVESLGKKIQSFNVFHHPLACHQTKNRNLFRNQEWIDYDCIQGPTTTDLDRLYDDLTRKLRSEDRPCFAQETLWTGNRNHPDYTDAQLRKNAYVICMAAATLNFGDMKGNSSSGFSGGLELSDRNQARHDIIGRVWDFFETVEFWKLSPRPDLVDNGFCLARPGDEYLIYLQARGGVEVKITGGPYQATWINAQKTSDRRDGGTITLVKKLTTPNEGDDWLLRLAKKSDEGAGNVAPLEAYRAVVKSTDKAAYARAAGNLRHWLIRNDPYRPLYHFTGPESWINDPNGPIYYKGIYHLFYQYDPVVDGRRSRRCWGHAVSKDLVHWEDWPVAIRPDSRYDKEGVYSGNTFIHKGRITALYTGNVRGHMETYGMLAWSEDGGVTFRKKMVMDNRLRPNSHSPVHWDAQIWKEGDAWCQLIGGATEGGKQGAAWLWKSRDLENWKLARNIAPAIKRGGYWELPYLVPLDGRHLLMVGAGGNPYWIGGYDAERMEFTPQTAPRSVDPGHYYSFNPHMVDDKGPNGSERRIMHGWAQIGRPPEVPGIPYWESAHTIPRVLTIKNNRLRQEPIPELQSLHYERQLLGRQTISAGKPVLLPSCTGDALEIVAAFDMSTADRCGLIVRANDRGEGTMVWAGPENTFGIAGIGSRHYLKKRTQVALHIFVDRGVIESYCDGEAVTHKCFAPRDSTSVFAFSEGGDATLVEIEVWKMKSMWR